MNLLIEMTGQEFMREYNVALIGETFSRGSSPYNTFSGKRKFALVFKESDRPEVERLAKQAIRYFKYGAPEKVVVNKHEMTMWIKLSEYVLML